MNRELNLVPQVYKEGKKSNRSNVNAILGIVGVIIIIALCFGYAIGKEAYLNVKEKDLQEKVALNKDLIAKEQELQESIDRTKAHIEKAKTLSTIKSKKTDEIFSKLQSNFPASVKLTDLKYTKDGFTATGTSASKEDIEVLWANLRVSTDFKNSYITSITQVESSFSFTLEVKLASGGVNNEAK